MSKSLEEILFSAENQAAAHEAVRSAVEQAAAAGLPPAYALGNGELAWLKQDPELLKKQRQVARQAKRQRDDEHRERHRQVLQLLDGPQREWILKKAREQINKWESNHLCNPRYVFMWREWLDMPPALCKVAVLREDDLGVSMRQNSPFSHAFSLVDETAPK